MSGKSKKFRSRVTKSALNASLYRKAFHIMRMMEVNMIDATMFSDEIQNVLKPLYRISYGILCSHTEAEDAIQQVLLKAWSSRGKVNLDKF